MSFLQALFSAGGAQGVAAGTAPASAPAATVAPYLPLAVGGIQATGSIIQGVETSRADKYNAAVMQNEKAGAINQASAQAGMQERAGREALGKQLAAFGGAGVGYGGSSEVGLKQSAVNQELDVLNTKYKGAVAGYGYGVQGSILQREAGQTMTASTLLAGGQALTGLSKYYTQPGMPSML